MNKVVFVEQDSTHNNKRLAVDIGGTFIDYIVLDEGTGEIHLDKQPASANNLVAEFNAGLDRLPVPTEQIDTLVHGTTVAVNALVQGKGATVGLLTTDGFRDVLEIQRGGRPEVYNFQYLPATPLVPRYLRQTVQERMSARGEALTELDTDDVISKVDHLVEQGVEAIAICFLHSYANPSHEQRAAEIVLERHPELTVSVSSDLVREWREFERSSTTVINSYLQPNFQDYAGNIEQVVRDRKYRNEIAFMRSNGGVMPISEASSKPVETLGSGPAGGVIGAHALMEETGYKNIVCADVGGTTYDVALIHDGEIVERTDTIIGGRPITGTAIDIVSVGAGGGSIAQIDEVSGSLRVGPESAGAYPGPACFGRGGERPTVTDSQVILGLLDPARFLGSRMTLDKGLAEAAVRRTFGENVDVERIANGIITIAQTNMANAIRVITTQRGLDPREFAMLSFGGGGGLFACGVAEELGIKTVLVPQSAAGFSAWGMLMADYREDQSRTALRDLNSESIASMIEDFGTLAQEATRQLLTYGFQEQDIQYRFSADIRFKGQDHTITTPVEETALSSDLEVLIAAMSSEFVRRHRQLYGHGDEHSELQIVTVRARAVVPSSRVLTKPKQSGEALSPVDARSISFGTNERFDDVPVYERHDIAVNQLVSGPAVVDEWTTTVIVPPRWAATIDKLGNLVMTFNEEDK